MRSRHRGLAVLAGALGVALALAGCTSTTAADGTSADPTANITDSSSGGPPPPSSPAASLSTSSVAGASTPMTTSSNPLPDGLTPDQIAQAQAAIAAYEGYTKLIDQAFTDPGRDWSAEIAKWATDPEKSKFLEAMAGTAALGQYGDGSLVIDPRVVKVEPGVVTLLDCVDATNVGFYDKSGNSIKAPNAPGTYFRHPSTVTVAEFQGGDQGDQWLVLTVVDDYSTSC